MLALRLLSELQREFDRQLRSVDILAPYKLAYYYYYYLLRAGG